jgi:hypothetical protein
MIPMVAASSMFKEVDIATRRVWISLWDTTGQK